MSSTAVVLAQQQASTARRQAVVVPPAGDAHPYRLWTLETISDATRCPEAAVALNWPLVLEALTERGVGDRLVCEAALGTIGVETAHTFFPVREAYWLPESWRAANLRYYPYYGRGYVQLTWESNYQKYGDIIGVNLVGNPDMAMIPKVAAQALTEYFIEADVVSAARASDWAEVRRRVQGAYAGLDELLRCVHILEANPRWGA